MAEIKETRLGKFWERAKQAVGRGAKSFWRSMEEAAKSGAYCVDQELGTDYYCVTHLKAGIDDGASLSAC